MCKPRKRNPHRTASRTERQLVAMEVGEFGGLNRVGENPIMRAGAPCSIGPAFAASRGVGLDRRAAAAVELMLAGAN